MSDLSIEKVIQALPTSELVDAMETLLEGDHGVGGLWPVLNEIERRDPFFEI